MNKKIKNPFIKQCLKEFRYLETDFGFKVISIVDHYYGIGVDYISSTAGVRVRYEPRERYIFIKLSRLIDGKMPKYDHENAFGLNNVLILRSPKSVIEPKPLKEAFTKTDLNIMLKCYAEAVRLYAADILMGDFSIFPELEKIVKERAEKYNKVNKIDGSI